jgi:hypothetical protein
MLQSTLCFKKTKYIMKGMQNPFLQSPLCFIKITKKHNQCNARSYASIPFISKKNQCSARSYTSILLMFQNHQRRRKTNVIQDPML